MKLSPVVKEIPTRMRPSSLHTRSICLMGSVLYVFLEKNESTIHAIELWPRLYKLGHPNNEACGWHPLSEFGLGSDGIFEVENSPWVDEYRTWNLNGPRYSEYGLAHDKHIVICLTDATLEVISSRVAEIQVTEPDLFNSLAKKLSYLEVRNG